MVNTPIVKGLPSTHADSYQLNTTTMIRHAARTYPEQEIVFRTADGGWDRYTYGESYTRIRKAANALKGLGIGAGDVVGILDWNSRRHFELYWAIPGLAAVMLQMNLRLAPEDLGYVTDHSDASWVLVDETLLPIAELLAPLAPQVKGWIVLSDRPLSEITTSLPNVHHFEDLVAEASDEIDWPVVDETSAYSACYTTGTTGRPKGIYYSHRGIYLHALAMVGQLGMSSEDTAMFITPMFHGQCWGLPQAAVQAMSKIVLPGRYVAEDTSILVDAMIAESVTVANGAPAIFGPMLDYIKTLDTKPDLSRARLMSGATEPPLTLMRGFHQLTGADVIHAYGATETTPMVAVNKGLKPSLRATLSDEQKWDRKRSQGLVVSGVDIRLVDGDGNDVPFDGISQGEVLLRGPWIIDSYQERRRMDLLDRHGERADRTPAHPRGRRRGHRAPPVAGATRRPSGHRGRQRGADWRDPRVAGPQVRQVAAPRHGAVHGCTPPHQRRQARQEGHPRPARPPVHGGTVTSAFLRSAPPTTPESDHHE